MKQRYRGKADLAQRSREIQFRGQEMQFLYQMIKMTMLKMMIYDDDKYDTNAYFY